MACKGSGVQIPSAPLLIMKKFLNETKELLLSQGLIAILAIIQVRIVATNLGPEIYGNIGVYLGFVGISFRFLSSRNSDLVLINFNETNKNFLNSALKFEFLLGSFSLLFVLSIFYLYYQFIPTYLWLFFLSRILLNVFEVFKGVYTHLGNMKIYSLLESSSNTIRFLLVVSFILNKPTIESFFYALGIHQLIVGLIVLIILLKNNHSTEEQISFTEYIKLSKNNFYKIRTDQAVGLIPIHLDVVIIGYFANYYSAGIYRIAKKLVDPINSLVVAFSPWILNKINNEKKYNFKNLTTNILIPTSVAIIFIYYFFGIELIEFIAGSSFVDSYTPMLILLIGYLSYYLTFWTRHFLLLNGLILKHTNGRILNLCVFLITSPFLISNYGFNGIASSFSLSILIQKIYELSVYFKNKNIENNI
tara:strand:+ start:5 stop:1261 length:1257 start_codon:yes stop_codon:yes gene_type:complete